MECQVLFSKYESGDEIIKFFSQKLDLSILFEMSLGDNLKEITSPVCMKENTTWQHDLLFASWQQLAKQLHDFKNQTQKYCTLKSQGSLRFNFHFHSFPICLDTWWCVIWCLTVLCSFLFGKFWNISFHQWLDFHGIYITTFTVTNLKNIKTCMC